MLLQPHQIVSLDMSLDSVPVVGHARSVLA